MAAHRCFKKGLAAGWTALTLLSVLSGDRMVALAQQPAENSHVGKRVITQPGTVLKVGNQVVDDEGLGKERAREKTRTSSGPTWLSRPMAPGSGWWPRAPAPRAGHRPLTSSSSTRPSTTSRARSAQSPGDWAKYVWRANVWLKRNELDTAIADYNEAIRLNPGSAGVAHQGRGRAWRGKKDYDKAIADCNEAIRLDPGHALRLLHPWRCLDRQKGLRQGHQDYDEAIRLEPENALAFSNRGLALVFKKDYDKAIQDFNEAIRLEPRYALAFYSRGNTWIIKQDYDKAIADYNEAIRLYPGFGCAYYNRGVAFLLTGSAKVGEDVRGKCSSLKGGGASIHSMPCSGAISVYGGPAMQTQRRGCSTTLRPGATPRPGLIR